MHLIDVWQAPSCAIKIHPTTAKSSAHRALPLGRSAMPLRDVSVQSPRTCSMASKPRDAPVHLLFAALSVCCLTPQHHVSVQTLRTCSMASKPKNAPVPSLLPGLRGPADMVMGPPTLFLREVKELHMATAAVAAAAAAQAAASKLSSRVPTGHMCPMVSVVWIECERR
jgi:hypothetical protein